MPDAMRFMAKQHEYCLEVGKGYTNRLPVFSAALLPLYFIAGYYGIRLDEIAVM